MNIILAENEIKYEGYQLAPHWIYKNFNIQGDSIVAFIGPVDVKLDEMVDIEDVIASEPISSDLMLNFIIEIFEIPLIQMVYIQRLFMTIIKETLEARGIEITRGGDDLFYNGKKLSVSIATKSITSGLIHSALNVKSSGCPIEVSSLNDMNIYDIKDLAKEIMQKFANEIDDIKLATTKVRGVFWNRITLHTKKRD